MKKRITLIIALAFAIALAICGSTAAFAAEENETINWYFDDELWEYQLIGEAKEGKNTIPAGTEGYELCYKFNAEKSGYYLVSFSYEDFDWIGFPDMINHNDPIDIAERIYVKEGYCTEILYYVESGANYLGADHFFSNEDTSFSIEFIGSEIKDLTFGKDAFKDYLINYDVEENYYYDNDYEYVTYEDTTVTFNSGKTIFINNCRIFYDTNNDEINIGKNKITVNLFDFEKETDMTVCNADKFVSRVELTNMEYYLRSVEYYNGYAVPEIWCEDLTVHFTDGTSRTVNFDYGYGEVMFPNGKFYPIEYSYLINDNESVELVFYIAYENVSAHDCEIQSTDFIENFRALYDNKIYFIKSASRSIMNEYSDYMWYSDTHEEYLHNLPYMLNNCKNYTADALYQLACNNIGFIGYIATGHVYSW